MDREEKQWIATGYGTRKRSLLAHSDVNRPTSPEATFKNLFRSTYPLNPWPLADTTISDNETE